METPYIVRKGAKVARGHLNKAMDAHSKICELANVSNTGRDNLYAQPTKELEIQLQEIHEWLYAIEGER